MDHPPAATASRWASPATKAFLFDAVLAVACYFAVYRLRFDVIRFSRFFPTALQALPFIVGCQLLALLLVGVYRHRNSRRWLPRLIGGIAAGSAVGVALAAGVVGLQGISRASFLIDPLLLLITAVAWRGVARLRRLAQNAKALEADTTEMVDRVDN